MKILEPKPPPTSGAMTLSLCSGASPMKAERTSRATCGFWLVVKSVMASVPESYSATAARGSMAFGISRLFTRSSFVTCAADAKAASVAALSPMCQLKIVLLGATSCSCGWPGLAAFAVSTTAGNSV